MLGTILLIVAGWWVFVILFEAVYEAVHGTRDQNYRYSNKHLQNMMASRRCPPRAVFWDPAHGFIDRQGRTLKDLC